ncbi:serine/threonine-protein kinase [Ktedonospora formicarum]|uniref:non-specific serine/threonine protein kinase n=1 Tax=Ktedonospora formicarum TaxID=2778364 RepID=A0A8J3I9S0_9CHLR|nr:serine/threonine-protein kinase [Ktedonospora formicarum]GHO50026.1 hypothetical protein KSX_81890 [Ktedonospora formicarum]
MQELAEGQMFARYRILRALGSSLVGESYAAEDTLLDHTVTLKVTHPWPSLPNSARYQFFQEMQGISLIVHPQLTAILDCGDAQGRLYITRTHTEAGSLLSDVGRTHFPSPLTPATAIGYASQLAEALQYLHNKGYIHGALTFSNILINSIPNASASLETTPFLIADAGYTYFAQHMGQLQTIMLPATAAPEQWQHHYSPACDQYALGVILYFWLAGRLPFQGRPQEVLRQKQYGLPPSLIALNPYVTMEQEAILLRALHPTPRDAIPPCSHL